MAGQPAGGVAVVRKARDAEMRKLMGSRFAPLQNRDTRGQRSSERETRAEPNSVRSSSAEAGSATWKPKPAPPPGKPPQWQQSTAESAAGRPDRYSTRPKPPPPAGPPPPLTSKRQSDLGSPPPLTSKRQSDLGSPPPLTSKRESDLGRTLSLSPRHSELPAPTATADPTARPPPPRMGALPAGWSVARDPEGYPYYYNLSTGENTYDRPGGVPPPPPTAKPPPPPADMVEGCATSSAAPVAESSAAPVAAEPSAVPAAGPTEEEAAAALWGRCGLSLVDEATPLAPPPLATSEPDAAPAAALEAASSTTAALPSADAPAVASEPAGQRVAALQGSSPPDEGRPISPPPLDEHSASSSFMLLGKMVRSAKSLVARPGGDEDARAARKESLRAADHLEADAYRDATRSRPTRQFRRRKVKASEAVLEGHGAGGAASPHVSSASCPPAAMEPTMPAAPKRGGRRSTLGASLAGVRARVRGSVRGSVHGMRRSIAGPPTSLPTTERNDLSIRATREMREHVENAI